ncbi:epsin-2 isoform X2 [Copidosoma floridanum]|uniref:epsin-2 isoform X2 n=1 Tax=Copidosoma floridanum TaxID=29053 RepID=UPI000C6FB149|nr:epsin-2 isoform X2 [Copidosoma floridanum]
MRRQGQDVMQVNLAGIRRDIVNLAHNYSNAQKAVRKATSNDPWGPSSTLMAEIADLTYNVVAFTEIMQMLWKRLNDHGKNWRHVYKALMLLEYLIKTGSEKVAQQCKENIFAIQTLKDFQYMEGHKDQGINVREKAKSLVALLRDDERLRNERARALKAKERFAQSLSGFGSDGVDSTEPSNSDFQEWVPCHLSGPPSRPELEDARPQTVGEEELQLQLALAMSREEAEQEEQRRRSDDVRLQLALSQSQQDFKSPQEKPSHMLDLLDVNLGEPSASASASAQADPWGLPIVSPTPPRPQQHDPWAIPTATSAATPATAPITIDPWAPVLPHRPRSPAATVDPWKPPAPSPATVPPASNRVTVDPWAPVTTNNADNKSSPLGFSVSATATPSFNTTSNGLSSAFTTSPLSQVNGQSPLNDLDEFDIISNRNKMGSSPQPMNNGNTTSPDPFDLRGLGESMPPSTGAIKKTPQSFLGENSALVNLDNLVSASTIKGPAPAPAAPAFSANPFAPVTPPPRPSINQIRQDPWINTSTATSTPTPTAAANPFLS